MTTRTVTSRKTVVKKAGKANLPMGPTAGLSVHGTNSRGQYFCGVGAVTGTSSKEGAESVGSDLFQKVLMSLPPCYCAS